MKKHTIKDIAKMAGVSKGTVDRVIHKRGKVSQKALEKVTKLLEEIDYQPNPIARNLKNNKVYQIYVVIPNPEEDSFWEPCIKSVNDAIAEFKSFGIVIKLFFYSPNSTKSFKDINNEILNLSPYAVLLAPLFYKESISVVKNYQSAGIKVSTFNNQIDSKQVVSFVGQNLFQSGRVAARLMHMITPKNSEIIICHIDETFNNALHMQQKEKGFRDYFDEQNHDSYTISTLSVSQENLYKSLITFLKSKQNISGIFVTTSKVYKVVEILRDNNLKNIKLIGYDLLTENIDFLKEDIISFLIHQNPKTQTYLGLTYLVEHFLFDKEIQNQKLLPIDIVNSENLSSYIEN
ncbi:LacI family DNA-binding transcriptional regulator [Flavivirga aquimarina]|uniref:LacI family DNA-binding transcriptional regulator n=1 Tax=Flavivirga aquimarina TaxID=2027862 RepID=A0ABT8W784_9FLAO|nr:LacI family DNA-binding transcriptional regulator [Flavivirga aquimarina]MDO5968973.1 LacI family DNA-binding transcriptional regulator [Flavivirga aquimarina]